MFKAWLCSDLWNRMRHTSQMHPWQPGECAEQTKQPLCVDEREKERECVYETTTIRRDLSDM